MFGLSECRHFHPPKKKTTRKQNGFHLNKMFLPWIVRASVMCYVSVVYVKRFPLLLQSTPNALVLYNKGCSVGCKYNFNWWHTTGSSWQLVFLFCVCIQFTHLPLTLNVWFSCCCHCSTYVSTFPFRREQNKNETIDCHVFHWSCVTPIAIICSTLIFTLD